MFNIKEVQDKISELKKSYKKIFSNSLLMQDQIIRLSQDINTFTIFQENMVLIFKRKVKFSRLNFYVGVNDYSQNIYNDIKKALDGMNLVYPAVIDLVGKESQISNHAEKMSEAGFQIYSHYHRWIKKVTDKIDLIEPENVTIQYADRSEIDEVYNMIDNEFHYYISNIPNKEKLKYLREKNELYCLKKNGVIVGASSIESIGKKMIHIHSIVISNEYRKLGLSLHLYNFIINNYEIGTVFTDWVDDINTPSIAMNKHVGFKPDGIMGYYIMVYNNKMTRKEY